MREFPVHMIVLCLLLLLLPGMAASGFYKWTDSSGKVHYSDKPHTQQAEEMHLQKYTVSLPALDNDELSPAEKRQKLLDAMQEDRDARNQAAKKRKQERKERELECKKLKIAYKKDSEARALYDWDENNQRRFLSDEERAQHLQDMRKAMEHWCH
ncbi:MAG: DUF4124 domain-containing protein [gamma proteobacterium symbiont of Bathyaustriella thionipta]|nr:DUF4124 domain-containing protein [gamma proteobacterium symbiont of Bathyaustriella thionipta]